MGTGGVLKILSAEQRRPYMTEDVCVSSYMICSYSWLSFAFYSCRARPVEDRICTVLVPIGELCTESCFVTLRLAPSLFFFRVSCDRDCALCFCGGVVSGFQWNSPYFLGAGSRPPQYVI